ncbi:hypothetical protein HYV81_00700 [Candidatus Woesearchaeota archaeon]|nr:hypothetical protein [Candidatus Woesearchaeota archaeon]
MYKKAQAAMEFLMTYGWAILVVLVAIGALAYFGVLNPSKFLPSSCVVTPGISCDDHRVVADGSATIVLRNGVGQDLSSVVIKVGGCGGDATGPTTIADGSQGTYTYALAACTVGAGGSKFKADLNVSYAAGGSSVTHKKVGQLVTNVESS